MMNPDIDDAGNLKSVHRKQETSLVRTTQRR
jgi:hypothetical protein